MVNALWHSKTVLKVRVTPGVTYNKEVLCSIAHMCLTLLPPFCLYHNRISFQQNSVSQQEQGKKTPCLALPCLASRLKRMSCGCSFPGPWRPELGQPQGTMGWAEPAQVCPGWRLHYSPLPQGLFLPSLLSTVKTPEHCLAAQEKQHWARREAWGC